MKIRLLKDVGNKKAGTILTVSSITYGALLQEGVAERYTEPVAPSFPIFTTKTTAEKPVVIKKAKTKKK